VQRLRLPRRLSELLNASGETADDVTAGERRLHGGRRQPAFKIIKRSTCFDPGNDLQLAELGITHHQDRVIGIG
jgi:hypothetical protein